MGTPMSIVMGTDTLWWVGCAWLRARGPLADSLG
jgi:hypothetical protein